MDEFNAKKARARKLRQDKHHDKPRKQVEVRKPPENAVPKATEKSLNTDKATANETKNDTGKGIVEDQSRSFSRRKITSNWDRYEEELSHVRPDLDDDNCGAHFDELLSMPISSGHMKFKNENEWDKEKSELQLPWFQLDLKSLEKNLSSIPFLKRLDLPPSIFSDEQLQRMTTRAKQHTSSLQDECLLKLQNILLSKEDKCETDGKKESVKNQAFADSQIFSNQTEQKSALDDFDLDDLLALPQKVPKSPSKALSDVTSKTSKKELVLGDGSGEPRPLPMVATQPLSEEASLPPLHSTVTAEPSGSLDDWLDSILDD